jgi:4-alpha-glucanotransferase
MTTRRCSGVLLHPTSLPAPWGVGDLGPMAVAFLDLLQVARQSVWEVLPLTPVPDHGSPYSAQSLFAGNPLLISPELLHREGYLRSLPSAPSQDPRYVDYRSAIDFKTSVLEKAFDEGFERAKREPGFSSFASRNSYWLDDFSLYRAIRKEQGNPWNAWPEAIRAREPQAMDEARARLAVSIDYEVFVQYLFDEQWRRLSSEAKARGITVMGDVPFYCMLDSSDAWAHRELFKVDKGGRAIFVGGVPPDYFSRTGQRWGNPVYDWEESRKTGYSWWEDRLHRSLELAPLERLDHFRGYVAYWEIPSENQTAMEGTWVKVPGDFIDFLKSAFPSLPFVAEDLGIITNDVVEAREKLGVPGMEVLLFAWDGQPENPYFPPNNRKNSFIYPGTHDTNTVRGWFEEQATPSEVSALQRYLGHELTGATVSEEFVSMAMGSVSDGCVIPMQDLLGLGREGRMNDPSTTDGNWRWRALPKELDAKVFEKLGAFTLSASRG